MTTYCDVKLLTPSAKMPMRGSEFSAGMDVCADLYDETGNERVVKGNQDSGLTLPYKNDAGRLCVELYPGGRLLIPTGIAIGTSTDIYTRVAPRSGLAFKNGLDTLAGVVDADYTDEVGVILINTDPKQAFEIEHGMRIAQLVLTHVSIITPRSVSKLETTTRGSGGFGSTGV